MMGFIKVFFEYVSIFFVCYMLIYSTFLFLSVTVGTSVLYKKLQRRRMKNELQHDYYIPISIIVPAYNEEITVIDTVESLLNSKYQLFEIVVVDDGSTDNTSQVLIDHFELNKIERPIRKQIQCMPEEACYLGYRDNISITLIRKKNGGKADSLNMGINSSQFPYFICMDADSMLQDDALEKIIQPILEDRNIIACGGLINIANGVTIKHGKVIKYKLSNNILIIMQALEYNRSFLASRIFWDQFNGNLIISGAFGLFKKDIVINVGGYDYDSLGEDMELVIKLHSFCRAHKIPYSIKYEPDAICWSQVPETISDLIKQRRRWHLGLTQSLWKHKRLIVNPRSGISGLTSYLYYIFYELLSPFIELFGLLTILLAFTVNIINVQFMIMFYLIYAGFGTILSLTAFFSRIHTQNLKIEFVDVLKIIFLCILENVGLRLFISFVRMTSFFRYKRKYQWGEIKRQKMNVDM